MLARVLQRAARSACGKLQACRRQLARGFALRAVFGGWVLKVGRPVLCAVLLGSGGCVAAGGGEGGAPPAAGPGS